MLKNVLLTLTIILALTFSLELKGEDMTEKGLIHLESREGTIYKSYKDSLGKLTGGTGHLLTKAEQILYPEGTVITHSVVRNWIANDVSDAEDSAREQAKHLGIDSEEFIEALIAVNFQLGVRWNKIHKRTWRALVEKKYKVAVIEINSSIWKRQTPVRVKDFEEAINGLSLG